MIEAEADLPASINVCMNGNGWSPLIVAAWSGHAAVVAELIKCGADPSTSTTQEHLGIPQGSTALSVAQGKGHKEAMLELLGVEA